MQVDRIVLGRTIVIDPADQDSWIVVAQHPLSREFLLFCTSQSIAEYPHAMSVPSRWVSDTEIGNDWQVLCYQ